MLRLAKLALAAPLFSAIFSGIVMAECEHCGMQVPKPWGKLAPVLTVRLEQPQTKMKLTDPQVDNFIAFLEKLDKPAPALQKLQLTMPKTTLELLRSVESRGVALTEAEKIAAYMQSVPAQFQIRNVAAFDENTSHIIGREWFEIDYSGEAMTWEKQQEKYQPYGITNFKTVANLEKFFPVEAKLPYFVKTYGGWTTSLHES